MNWDNQNNNKDPWGRNNNDGPDFDDLIKRFSMIFGNKGSSNGGGPSGGIPSFPLKRILGFVFFGLLIKRRSAACCAQKPRAGSAGKPAYVPGLNMFLVTPDFEATITPSHK